MNLAEELLEAFSGFSTAHGQTEVSQERTAGKQKAKSFIVRNPLTLELIEGHINGKKGVGAIPINEENKCKFGALDIDQYPYLYDYGYAHRRKLQNERRIQCIS